MLSYLACLVGGSNCLTDSSSKLTFFLGGAMFIVLSVWAGRVTYAVLSIRVSSTRMGAAGLSKIALVITPAAIPATAIEGITYLAACFTPRPSLAVLLGCAIARSNLLK